MSWAYHASSTTISYHTGNMGHAMIALVPKRGAAESPRPTCASVSGELADSFCDGAAYGSNGLKPNVAGVECGAPGDTACDKAAGDAALCCALAPPPEKKPSSSVVPLDSNMALEPTLLGDASGFSRISLTVTCKDCGWFALGVSSDGSMTSGGQGSDIAYCADHTEKKSVPRQNEHVLGHQQRFTRQRNP
jgi:hypothetical protein